MTSMPAMVRGTVTAFIGAGVSRWTGKGSRGHPSSWTWMKLTLGGLVCRARPIPCVEVGEAGHNKAHAPLAFGQVCLSRIKRCQFNCYGIIQHTHIHICILPLWLAPPLPRGH